MVDRVDRQASADDARRGAEASCLTEHFVIAHEIGHVLAHGRLMYAGMVVSEGLWEALDEENDRRRLTELEANIYALLGLVPEVVINLLEEVLGVEVDAAALQDVMQRLAGIPFDFQLARERLLLRDTLAGRVTIERFRSVVFDRTCSWTMHGAAAEGRFAASDDAHYESVSDGQFHTWLASLCQNGLLDPSDWPRARALLAAAGRHRLVPRGLSGSGQGRYPSISAPALNR